MLLGSFYQTHFPWKDVTTLPWKIRSQYFGKLSKQHTIDTTGRTFSLKTVPDILATNFNFFLLPLHDYVHQETMDLLNKYNTLSGKSRWEKRNVLWMRLPKSKTFGNFLQHIQKSKIFDDVFWRNRNLKFFLYKTSRDWRAKITKGSAWRSGWNEKSH